MRLDKFLCNLKYGSRNDIKKLCKNNAIRVNNEIVKKADIYIDPLSDIIEVDGEVVFYKENITLMMNKPQGYICSTVDEVYMSLLRLLDKKYSRFDFKFAGRLDWDTEGLVILSTDGRLIHEITSPKKEMYKTYYVKTNLPLINEVIYLKRIQIGNLVLPSDLEVGEYREIEPNCIF